MEAGEIRGAVINALTVLERTIDLFLSYHFSANRDTAMELMNNVFATRFMTFENKRIIFHNITEAHYKEYKNLQLKGVHGALEKFNKHRNALAHYVIDNSTNSITHFKNTGEVTFLKFEKSIEKALYSEKIAVEIIREILPFADLIHDIIPFKK